MWWIVSGISEIWTSLEFVQICSKPIIEFDHDDNDDNQQGQQDYMDPWFPDLMSKTLMSSFTQASVGLAHTSFPFLVLNL